MEPNQSNGKERTRRPTGRPAEGGQALIELVGVVVMCCLLLFGVIDFGRFIYERQILVNVTREGANLFSRYPMDITNSMDAVINSAVPLNISSKGCVIMSTVTNFDDHGLISFQFPKGDLTSASSKIGRKNDRADLPSTAFLVPVPPQKLYVCEVFYTFTPITPLGKLLALTLPTTIYDVAFF